MDIDNLCINTIRTLSADVVQKANSGHPGAPMGMAPMAHVLFSKIMNFAPHNPKWANRDRFVLSNGHACALQYVMLHLLGYDQMTMGALKQFRQLESVTPGHPEMHMTDGIEVTTGPLGQGIANAVGMAIGQAHFGALFNKPGFNLFDNFTYAFCGDGCLQEGISGEASSMAGHLGLGNLIVLYDDNNITIDGETDLSFTEDVPARYRSYGWQTLSVSGGDSNIEGILAAIQLAKTCSDKPTLISVKTTIGFGSSKAGTHGVHGAPLGNDDLAKTKAALGLDSDKKFNVSSDVYNYYAGVKQAGYEAEGKWNAMLEVYTKQYPELAAELTRRLAGKLPAGWKDNLPKYTAGGKAVATRNCSGAALKAIANAVPELVGGSADLTPSNKTQIKSDDFQKSTPHGRYFRFGVREHGMAAIGNGLNAYNNLIPFTATFLNFLEYLFPALRLTALSEQQQIFIMTHDSIALGEDGPTHQPIEALAICRATPNCLTFRPADGNETNGAYIQAMEATSSPSVLALTRQGLPQLAGTSQEKVALGGYVVEDCKGKPDVVFVATGSEVSLAIDAAKLLTGHKVRVVSMPCVELFERQSVAYRRSVITPGVPTIAIEMLAPQGWEKFSHHVIAMRTFGASGPAKHVLPHFGFSAPKVAGTTVQVLKMFADQWKELGCQSVPPLATHMAARL